MPSANYQYKGPHSRWSIRSARPHRVFPKQKTRFPSEALALSGNRHSGIVNVNQAPLASYFLIELRFSAMRREGSAIFSELGSEIPIKFGPGRVPENVYGNVVNG